MKREIRYTMDLRQLKYYFYFLLLMGIGSSCTNTTVPLDKQVITVSILPQKYFVEKICGEQFHVNVMIPPGESPATYDPTPTQMVQMEVSEVYFLIGHIEFEKSWIIPLSKEKKATSFINTSTGVDLQMDEHEGHGHRHSGVDPHIWMSAKNVKIITQNMLDYFIKTFPENQDIFIKNHRNFLSELDSLHQTISSELNGIRKREFIIYHPALSYYARDYQLEQIPLEFEGKEPSAKHLKGIIDRANSDDIKAILVQKQFNQQEAITIEKEINGKVISIDPLDYHWKEQMTWITSQLKNALK